MDARLNIVTHGTRDLARAVRYGAYGLGMPWLVSLDELRALRHVTCREIGVEVARRAIVRPQVHQELAVDLLHVGSVVRAPLVPQLGCRREIRDTGLPQ